MRITINTRMLLLTLSFLLALLYVITTPLMAQAREQIIMVGSSTVAPLASKAAEEFGANGMFKTPVVESTGTGGGFKEFCGGVGYDFPDFSNASRRILPSEKEQCAANGVKAIGEITLGLDGIIFAENKEGPDFKLTTEQLFKAMAKEVPQGTEFVANPYKKWKDIDSSLPDAEIAIYGQPNTSGTYDVLVEHLLVDECKKTAAYKASPEDEKYADGCFTVRRDGPYIFAKEDENLTIGKLKENTTALGVIGYSFYEQNQDVLKAATINGVHPDFDNIYDSEYTLSRPIFVYVKTQHIALVPGMKEFVHELIGEKAVNEIDGYLLDKGLIPLSEDKRTAARAAAEKGTYLVN